MLLPFKSLRNSFLKRLHNIFKSWFNLL